MATGAWMQPTAFSVAVGDRQVICPKPRRLYPVSANKPLRWTAGQPAEVLGPFPACDLFDLLLPKGAGESIDQADPVSTFFCGSPPSRSNNPVVHDARFGEAVPVGPPPSGSGFSYASTRSGCARLRYGHAPAAVRIEGFDCDGGLKVPVVA
ncbi:hypothetical protein HPP92_022836 [Vanilla planifolia]|uniref:Uncharacterized protein n=1 Tax=Vanilla planifolia TaxID=51239 RepID=A0A835PZ18_VANPL|nr:hypothetical protein HPP92_022836 [Vanilla planifolia]